MEEYKIIDGYENYEVSIYGEVVNTKTGNCIKGSVNHSGYLMVGLFNNGKKCTRPMHRLVALAFIPNPENKQYVRHYDGDNLNNEVANLYWQSYAEFMEWGYERDKARANARAQKTL